MKIDYNRTEQYIKSIRKEWEKFIEKGVVDKEVIRPIVLESWKRSKEWGGVILKKILQLLLMVKN